MIETNKQNPLFRPQLVLVLVLISVFSLSAFLALSAFAKDFRNKSNGGTHAWSRSAVGFAAFAQMLEASGQQVLRSRIDAEDGRPFPSLTIVTPTTGQSAQAILDASVSRTLVVLPKWQTRPDRKNRQWVAGYGLLDHARIARMLNDIIETANDADTIEFAGQIARVASAKPENPKSEKPQASAKKTNGKWPLEKQKTAKEKQAKQQQRELERTNAKQDAVDSWQIDQRFGNAAFQTGKIDNLQTISQAGLAPLVW
ncbi:hypothetical protein MNBD_ALPHA06-668, partial [hydrothermal vent metagenome]